MPSSLQFVRSKYRRNRSLSCMNWIKLFVSQYQDIWSCLIMNTNRNICPRKKSRAYFFLLQPEAKRACRMYTHTSFGKFHQTMKPHDCLLSQLKICMYIHIFCIMSSIKHRIRENKDSSFGLFLDTWLPYFTRVCAQSVFIPVCLYVCLDSCRLTGCPR